MKNVIRLMALGLALLVTAPSWASTASGSIQLGTACFCGTSTEGEGLCFQDGSCADLADCGSSADCGAGQFCLFNNCCGVDKCVNVCTDGTACSNPGVCGTYDLNGCDFSGGIPTVSEWGLIIMTGLLLAAGAFLIWKHAAKAVPAIG